MNLQSPTSSLKVDTRTPDASSTDAVYPGRTDSHRELDDELVSEFGRMFPELETEDMNDPAQSWLMGIISNFGKAAFGAYQEPIVDGLLERTYNQNTIRHLNWNWLKHSMSGMLKIELKDVINFGKSEKFFGSRYHHPYITFSTGDSFVQSEAINPSPHAIWNSTHFLNLRKLHLEADMGKVLTISLYAKDTSPGFRAIVNRFKKDVLLGSATICIDQLTRPGTHEMEIPLTNRWRRGLNHPFVRFLVTHLGIEEAMNELGKNEMSGAWTETGERFNHELQWPEITHKTGMGQIETDPVAFVDSEQTGSQAWVHVHRSAKIVIVAFRGTETNELQDLITDASILPAQLSMAMKANRYAIRPTRQLKDSKIRLHSGFLYAYDSVRESILRILYDITGWNERWTICLTGHSLGGALATICAFELANRRRLSMGLQRRMTLRRAVSFINFGSGENTISNGPKIGMISFGAPRVGNLAFVKNYDQTIGLSLRIVTPGDPVCALPFLYYMHTKRQVVVEPDGQINYAGKVYLPSMKIGRRSRGLSMEDIHFEASRESSSMSIKNHSQPTYFEHIRRAVDNFFTTDALIRGHARVITRVDNLSVIRSGEVFSQSLEI